MHHILHQTLKKLDEDSYKSFIYGLSRQISKEYDLESDFSDLLDYYLLETDISDIVELITAQDNNYLDSILSSLSEDLYLMRKEVQND